MRRKSHLKLSVVQKSFDSSTKVIPSLHLISLIAVRDPWTARESQAQCDFAFVWRYFFWFGIRNCLATMSLLILGRTGRGGGGGGGWMPPRHEVSLSFLLEYKTSAPDVFIVAVRSSLAQILGFSDGQLLWLRDMTS